MVRLSAVLLSLLVPHAHADEIGTGAELVRLRIDESELPMRGSGTRRKFGLVLYDAALYTAGAAAKTGEALLASDDPIAVRLEVRSRLFTKPRLKRMVSSAVGDAGAEVARGIDQMFDSIDAKIEKGDVVEFTYTPASGTTLRVNGKSKAAVEGTEFRRALFGIWIGESAVDDDLAESLVPPPATP